MYDRIDGEIGFGEVKVLYGKAIKLSIMIAVFLLVACSKSEEDIISETLAEVKDVFQQEELIDKNHEQDNFSYYLPEQLQVIDEDEHNIVLEGNDNVYVIFINQLEQPTSETMFNLVENDDALLHEGFEDDDMFGYIHVDSESEEEEHRVEIGVGGVKTTTKLPLDKLPSEAKQLMKIVKSIVESIS